MTDDEGERVHSGQSVVTFGEQSDPRGTSSSGDRHTAAVVVETSRGRSSEPVQSSPGVTYQVTSSRNREGTPCKRVLALTDTPRTEGDPEVPTPKSPRSNASSSKKGDPIKGQSSGKGDPIKGQASSSGANRSNGKSRSPKRGDSSRSQPLDSGDIADPALEQTSGKKVPRLALPDKPSFDTAEHFEIHSNTATPRRIKTNKSGGVSKSRSTSRSMSAISSKFEKVESASNSKVNAELESLKEELLRKENELSRLHGAATEEVSQIQHEATEEVARIQREAEVRCLRISEESQRSAGENSERLNDIMKMATAECEAASEAQRKYREERKTSKIYHAELTHVRNMTKDQAEHLMDHNRLLDRHVDEMDRKLQYTTDQLAYFCNIASENAVRSQEFERQCHEYKSKLDMLNETLMGEVNRSQQILAEKQRFQQDVHDLKADLNSRARTFENNIQAAQERVCVADKRVQDVQEELSRKNLALHELQTRVQKASSEDDAVGSVLKARISSLEGDLSQRTRERDEQRLRAEDLHTRNVECWEKCARLECDKRGGDLEVTRLQRKINDLNDSLGDAHTNIESMSCRNEQLSNERDELLKKKSEFNGCDPRCPKRVELEKKVIGLEEDIKARQSATRNAEGCRPDCPKRLELQKMIGELEDRVDVAESDLAAAQNEVDELKDKRKREIKEWRRERVELKNEVKVLETEVAELQDEGNRKRQKSRTRRSSAESSQPSVPRACPKKRCSSRDDKSKKPPPSKRKGSRSDPPDDDDGDGSGGGGDDDEEGEESEGVDPDQVVDDEEDIEIRVAKKVKSTLDSELSELKDQIKLLLKKADEKPTKPEKVKDDDPSGITIQVGEDGSDKVIVKKTDSTEKIVVPKFPSVARVSDWFTNVKRNICAATGKEDYGEISWMDEIQKPGTTFETLADSGAVRFKSVDIRLAVSLSACVKDGSSELYRELQRRESECMSEKSECLRGRQIMWMILSFFKSNRDMSVVYTVQDLTNLQWQGDKNMHVFRHHWEDMTSKLRLELTENCLSEILVEKLANSNELKEDIGHYRRVREGHEDKCYQYLVGCMDRYLQRARLDKNRQEFKNALKKSSTAAPAPNPDAPTKTKAEIKKEKKEKAKAKAAAAKAKAKAKADPKKPGGGGDASQRPPCRFFQDGKCNKGSECKFAHRKASKEELKKMKGDRSPSPAPRGGGDKKGDKNELKPPKLGHFCRAFLTPKGCPHGDKCIFPHMNEDEVNKLKSAHKNALAQFEEKRKKKAGK